MKDNVISLIDRMGATQKPSDISLSREQRSTTVHKLTSPSPVFHVYEERLAPEDEKSRNFFEILEESRILYIIHENGYIDSKTMLFTQEGEHSFHSMKIHDFIRFTRPSEGREGSENIYIHLMQMLNAIKLYVRMYAKKDILVESTMTKRDADIFHAEGIQASGDFGYYTCHIENKESQEGEFYIVDDFNTKEGLTLLELLCHAYQGYFGNACIVDDKQICIKIDSHTGIHVDSKKVSFVLFQNIILSAIARKDKTLLYSNFSSDKRIKMFYDKVVYPLLSEEYLTGEFEDE